MTAGQQLHRKSIRKSVQVLYNQSGWRKN